MNKRNLIFLLLTVLLIEYKNTFSMDDSKYGAYGGVNYNIHNALFDKLYGIPNCCPDFENGTGLGYHAGMLYEYSLNRQFWISGRVGLMTLDGELIKEETTTIISDGNLIDGVFEHKLSANFLNVGIEPTLMYMPFANFFISVGGRFGANLTSTFDQVESITSPEGVGTFLDSLGNDTHSRTRNVFSGDIPNSIPFQMALTTGISYELPLNANKNLILAPEITFHMGLTELVTDTKWKLNSIGGGIALKYYPLTSKPKQMLYEKKFEIDTVRIPSDIIADNQLVPGKETTRKEIAEDSEKIIEYQIVNRTDTLFTKIEYTLSGSITAVGVDEQGKEIGNPVFKIEEIVSNRLDPLLNYIFFEEGSYEIPQRYIKLSQAQAKNFEILSLFEDKTLDIYYQILNIIGKRLNQFPDADLTIVGCNSDIGIEKDNLKLSEARANNIQDYLVSVWDISPQRFKIEKKNLPDKPSTPNDEPDKAQENRRVELKSNNEKILEWIFIEKYDRKANPPIVRFKPEVKSDAGLKSWEFSSYQVSLLNLKFNEKGSGTIPEHIDWKLEEFQKIVPRKPEPIVYSLKYTDKKEQSYEILDKTLPFEVITVEDKRINRIGDYEIEKFSLILFDFDESTIDGINKRIIDFIIERIKPESEISITGYTDRTGDEGYNQQLSERRANSTKQALKRNEAKAQGIGEQKLLYDNDFPECRFYCRTVEIEVRTKVK